MPESKFIDKPSGTCIFLDDIDGIKFTPDKAYSHPNQISFIVTWKFDYYKEKSHWED